MNKSEPELEIFFTEWQDSSRLLFYSIITVSSITLPILVVILTLMRPHQNSKYYPYMCSIILGNFVLLSTVFFMVVSKNTDIFNGIIPGFMICKLSTFLVNTSSCFIHWTWVAMYSQRFIHVFYPFRFRRTRSSWHAILIVLISSAVLQTWALITMTELSFYSNVSSVNGGTYCAEHPYFHGSTKIIVLIESTVTFFLPFILTVIADCSVLISTNTWQSTFKLISADDVRRNNRSENMKIVSKLNLQSSEKRRSTAIKRCLISATLTLFLNLPNYVLQVVDEFYALRESDNILTRRIFLRADAVVYILYLLQFLIVPVNMYFLRQNITRSSRKHKEKVPLQVENSRSYQVIELSDASKLPTATSHVPAHLP